MADRIDLSLVSHTNVGKTTLARTLLGRDIGEVRDAPHVTDFADVHILVATPDGESLRLWDTPGFGDSLRLLRRLRLAGQPLGWFLSQVWDRWRDRAFWSSQQALRNVRDEADAMLYLVNAAESPEAAGYVAPEMEILAWVGKPVIVLLNQLGPPRSAADEAADLRRWRERLAAHPAVVAVLPFDAFARCWVQEFSLLAAVESALPSDGQRTLMGRLRQAWQGQRWATFDAAMQALSASLGRLASDREPVADAPGGRLRASLGRVGGALRAAVSGEEAADRSPAARAREALAERLAAEVQSSTAELIRLHRLSGRAEAEILNRLATQFDTRAPLDEGRAALWGGAVTGALAGLKADLLSGGLTMGGGLLVGGVVGALGAAGLARGVNLVRQTDRTWVAWNAGALDGMVEAALLRYLAVAHFGRGRGDWAAGESPPHWRQVVEEALGPDRDMLRTVWAGRDSLVRPEARASPNEGIAAALEPLLRGASLRSLQRLYPEVPELATFGKARSPLAGHGR